MKKILSTISDFLLILVVVMGLDFLGFCIFPSRAEAVVQRYMLKHPVYAAQMLVKPDGDGKLLGRMFSDDPVGTVRIMLASMAL